MKPTAVKDLVPGRLAPTGDVKVSAPQRRDQKGSVDVKRQAILLSIVMPAFNEANTIEVAVTKLLSLQISGDYELIVVNDGSTDETAEILAQVASKIGNRRLRILSQPTNTGKGTAVRRAIAEASGSYLLIFDADSEYDVADISRLVEPLFTGRAEVVYGVRLSGVNVVIPTLSHAIGNRIMTMTANLIYGAWLTDMHTCLKLVPVPLLKAMTLTENGFGLDTEITAEMLRLGYRPYEVPASYVGRTREEGKKIGFLDALRCFYVLGKVRLRGKRKPGLRDRSLAPSVMERPARASR